MTPVQTKRFYLTLCFIIGIGASRLQASTTADEFLKAYFLIQDADASEKTGDVTLAIDKYQSALEILRTIKKTYPDWDPKIVGYRLKYCIDHLEKNHERQKMVDEAVNVRVTELELQLKSAMKNSTVPSEWETRLRKAEDDLAASNAANEKRYLELVAENTALREKLGAAENAMRGIQVGQRVPDSDPTMQRLQMAEAEYLKAKAAADERGKLRIEVGVVNGPQDSSAIAANPPSVVTPEVADPRVGTLARENAALKQKLAATEAELATWRAAPDEAPRAELEAKLKKAEDQLKITSGAHDEQLQALLKENEALKKIMNESQEIGGQPSKEVEALKAELAETQSKLKEAHLQIKAGTEARETLEARLAALEGDPSGSRGNTGEINNLKAELARSQDELDRAQALVEAALEKERRIRVDVRDDLEKRLRATEEQLRVALAAHDSAGGADLAKENGALKQLLNELAVARKSGSSSEELSVLKAELAKTQAQFQNIQTDYQALKSNHDELRTAHEGVRKELESARLHMAQIEKSGEGTTGAAADDAGAALRKELMETRAQLNQLASLQEKYQGLQSANESLQRELTDLRGQLKLAPVSSPTFNLDTTAAADKGVMNAVIKAVPSDASVPADPTLDAAANNFSGSVVLLNPKENFVIVNFQPGSVPPLRSELGVYRENVFVGSVRITDPIKPPLASADILSGSIQRGDVVR